jgi:hypothetical protein
MIVNPGALSSVSIECKQRDALDGYEQAASQFWKHLHLPLRQRMTQSQLNYWVKVTAREYRLGDVDRVVKEAVALMRSVESGSATVMGNRYQIDCLRLAEPGGAIPSAFFGLLPRGVFGVNEGTADRSQVRTPRFAGDEFARGPVTDPIALRLELIDDLERRVRGVLRNLKNAAKQVRLGLPSVVYIDVNLGSYERESAEFENMVAAVAAQLQAAHTRVSAVVLVAAAPTRSLDDVTGWWIHTRVLPQPRPQYSLPANLVLPGDGPGSRWLHGRWVELP